MVLWEIRVLKRKKLTIPKDFAKYLGNKMLKSLAKDTTRPLLGSNCLLSSQRSHMWGLVPS